MSQSHEADRTGLFTEVRGVFSDLLDSCAPAARPEGLFETLLSAYSDADKESLVLRLRDFVASDGDRLRRVISEHTAGSPDYVETHDWLYMQPEVLLIADLAARRPLLLASIVKNTDFDRIVGAMIDELKGA
jgi:hypothetical protein